MDETKAPIAALIDHDDSCKGWRATKISILLTAICLNSGECSRWQNVIRCKEGMETDIGAHAEAFRKCREKA